MFVFWSWAPFWAFPPTSLAVFPKKCPDFEDAGNTLVELRANLPMSQLTGEPWLKSRKVKDRTLRPSCCGTLCTKGGGGGGPVEAEMERSHDCTLLYCKLSTDDCNQRAVQMISLYIMISIDISKIYTNTRPRHTYIYSTCLPLCGNDTCFV